jgi:hypothetical protein
MSIAVPATTVTMYDVFVYDNSGTPTLELLAWTNDTTRATALVRQDGHWCKTGDLTRLYVGSFRTTGVSGETEDSAVKRFVWNYYHQVQRPLRKLVALDGSGWSYSTATWRQADADASNQVEVVIGVVGATLHLDVHHAAGGNASAVRASTSIGEDSTSVVMTEFLGGHFIQVGSGGYAGAGPKGLVVKAPAVGYHFYAWLENAATSGTTSWGLTSSGLGNIGLSGWVMG